MAITSIPLPPATGTITLTNGSANGTGTGTGMKSRDVGDLLVTENGSVVVIAAKPTANGAFTITEAFGGTTETDVAYTIIPRSLSSQAAYFFQLLNLNISSQEGQLVWLWSTATEASDPGTGKVQINNAAWASATALYLSDTDQQDNDLGAWIATWNGSKVQVTSLDRPGVFGFATLGTVTDSTGYRTIVLSGLEGTPAFNDDERIGIALMPAGPQGLPGDDAYVYIAYASDASGTDFTTTFDAALDYIAILSTDTEIVSPAVGDFAGLWKKYKGAKGDAGSDGAGASFFTRVHVAATGNVDPATGLEAGDTIDDITLVEGWEVLLPVQTDGSQNGIYEVPASGAAPRVAEFSAYNDYPGIEIAVLKGTVHGGDKFRCTSDIGGTIDVTDLDFQRLFSDVFYKVFSPDGATSAFTLDVEPVSAQSVFVEISGVAQRPGTDYTISGTSLNFATDPPAGTNTLTTRVLLAAEGQATPPDGSVNTVKLANKAATFAKIQDISSGVLLGRQTAGAGAIEELTMASLGVGNEGSVVQKKTTRYSTYTSVTVSTPAYDDTIPQNTEGDQLITLTITPTSATNKIVGRCIIPFSAGAAARLIAAAFIDGQSDAIGSGIEHASSSGFFHSLSFDFEVVPGNTAERTISIRVGVDASTAYINGNSSTRRLGGSLAAVLTLEEVVAS